jgi:hypothetical protein
MMEENEVIRHVRRRLYNMSDGGFSACQSAGILGTLVDVARSTSRDGRAGDGGPRKLDRQPAL